MWFRHRRCSSLCMFAYQACGLLLHHAMKALHHKSDSTQRFPWYGNVCNITLMPELCSCRATATFTSCAWFHVRTFSYRRWCQGHATSTPCDAAQHVSDFSLRPSALITTAEQQPELQAVLGAIFDLCLIGAGARGMQLVPLVMQLNMSATSVTDHRHSLQLQSNSQNHTLCLVWKSTFVLQSLLA